MAVALTTRSPNVDLRIHFVSLLHVNTVHNSRQRVDLVMHHGRSPYLMPSMTEVCHAYLHQSPDIPELCLRLIASGRNTFNDEVRQDIHNLYLMMNEICVRQGIIPSEIPGFGQHPTRRSVTPSAHSASPSLPISSLNVSDVSSRSSSKVEEPGSSGMFYSYVYTRVIVSFVSTVPRRRQGTSSGQSSGARSGSSRRSSAGRP